VDCTNPCIASLIFLALDLIIGPTGTCKGSLRLGPPWFPSLNNRMMDQLCQQFKIQHHNSTPYRQKMNGAVEAANKNVKKILSKMTETYKDWHEHLPYALCTYQTSVRTSVGATPYSLVYGMEAVLPVEVEIPSLRILSQT
jgi:hypothetical protein